VTLKPGLGVTQGHRKLYHSIRHPWLPINVSIVTIGLSRTVSLINGDFRRKSHENRQFFPYLTSRWTGSPWNWVSTQGSEETRMMGLPDGRKSFKIGLAVLIQYRHVTDIQPASQPRRRNKYALCIYASRSKNDISHLVKGCLRSRLLNPSVRITEIVGQWWNYLGRCWQRSAMCGLVYTCACGWVGVQLLPWMAVSHIRVHSDDAVPALSDWLPRCTHCWEVDSCRCFFVDLCTKPANRSVILYIPSPSPQSPLSLYSSRILSLYFLPSWAIFAVKDSSVVP